MDEQYTKTAALENEIQSLKSRIAGLESAARAQATIDSVENMRTREIATLLNIAAILVAPGDFEHKSRHVLEELSSIMLADRAILRVRDNVDEVLRLVAFVDQSTQRVAPAEELPYGDMLTGLAYEKSETVVVNDYVVSPMAESIRLEQGICSIAALPVYASGEKVGTISVNSTHKGHFNADRVRVLEAIANGMGVLLENARLMESVQRSEHRFRALFEDSRDAIVITREGAIVDANQSAIDLFGFDQNNVRGYVVDELFVDTLDASRIRDQISDAGFVKEFEVRLAKLNGTVIECSLTSTRRTTDEGTETQTVIRDITLHKQNDRAIRDSEHQLRTLFEAVPIPVVLSALADGRILYANEHTANLFGIPADEVTNHFTPEFYYDSTDRTAFIDKLNSNGYVRDRELHLVAGQGNSVWANVSSQVIEYAGNPAVFSAFYDLTERRKAEELFRILAQSSPTGIVLIQKGRFIFVNSHFEQDTGFDSTEVMGMDALSLVHPEDIKMVGGRFEEIFETGSPDPVECRVLDKAGNTKWILMNVSPVTYEGSAAGLGTYVDITERKNAVDELTASLLEKEQLLEQIQSLYHQEQRRADQFRVISEVGQHITSILEIDELLEQVVSALQEAFDYYHVGIGLVENGAVDYSVVSGSLWETSGENFEPLKLEVGKEGIAGWVAETGEFAIVPDVSLDSRYVPLPQVNTRSELTVPIRIKDRVIGILDVQSDQIDHFDKSDLVVLQSLALQIGIAIDNARFFQLERRRGDQMRAISEVAIQASSLMSVDELLPHVVTLLRDTFGYYNVNIGLNDNESQSIEYMAGAGGFQTSPPIGMKFKFDGPGIGARVAGTGKAIVCNDVSEQPLYYALNGLPYTRSELAVPIAVGDSILGVLDIQSERVDAFDDAEVSTAQVLANQLAVAIENARLFEDSQDMAVLGERNRMAREIHDTLAQGFTGIVLQLEAGEEVLGKEKTGELQDHLSRAKELARECLQEARRSVWNLLPHELEERPLEAAIEDEVTEFASVGREHAEFSLRGTPGELPSNVQATLLRVCQESLTNVRKHAHASSVKVRLSYEQPNEVMLEVEDDGKGFEPDERASDFAQGGFGLTGMDQRARLLRGKLEVLSEKDSGTTIRVTLPIF